MPVLNTLASLLGITFGTPRSDSITGSNGNDTIFALWGNDWVYGDAAPNAAVKTVDLGSASTWSAVSADKTSIALTGLKVSAVGGVFDAFKVGSVEALGILSPNDDPTKIYAREIDTFVDRRLRQRQAVRRRGQ
ncbi:hypothetical protein [Sphingomonas solaris]|uniref:Uncharacterized protein n=1 Tax=Alterirhizorhabdus solaris TaxID=2529389 RepID=A0A558R0M4_9SPHN|nr:hypothetical protein [Sphingomonas solaris]TVV72916.1 hypothetical protein FOY91_13205 [Sphingomonas solaris]